MKENGNTHKQHDCPYCWRVLYSKGALTNHMNKEHWDYLDADEDNIVHIMADNAATNMSEYKDREVIEMLDEFA